MDIVFCTDGTTSPSTSLFDIGQELSTSPYINHVQFASIGHIAALTSTAANLNCMISVRYKRLWALWQVYDNMPREDLESHTAEVLARRQSDFAERIYRLYGHWCCMHLFYVRDFVERQSEEFWREMPRVCPAFAQGDLWSSELWTWLAAPYGRRSEAVVE